MSVIGPRAWTRLPADLLRFATTERHELNVAVMCVFDDAAVLRPALTFDQVRAGLLGIGWDHPLDEVQLQQTLEALTKSGLLDVTQNHAARYATPEEFERKNLQWSLTAHGQAAISGVLHTLDVLAQTVSLQPAVIDAIADALADIAAIALTTPVDTPRIATRLAEIEAHLASLVANVRQFNTQLQRLLREDATSNEVFEEVKRRTVAYLKEYVDGVERPARRVATNLERVADHGVSIVFDHALTGANLAPVAGADPSIGWLAERAKRWDALRAWFAPTDDAAPRIASLVDVARHAILQLLRVLERRWEARRRSASIADDFRALANWFAQAIDDEEAQRLFVVAFGLWPARHANLRVEDADAVASTTPWNSAPPVLVAPALRTTGTLVNRGRVPPVRDPAAVRARRQREQAEAFLREEKTRLSLRTSGRVRLSSFSGIDKAAFIELLALLSEALGAPRSSDGGRRSCSTDGRLEIVLRDAGDGRLARLRTEAGILSAPDYIVEIAVVGGVAASNANEVASA
jgi:uncharacterized protein (TIGR02677 family)